MTTLFYFVDEVDDMGNTPCSCGSCEWTGTASEVTEVEGCALTPGHPSPVGRCPECDSLAYVDRDEDSNDPQILRKQAAEVIRRAQKIDGLNPFIITHSHEFGSSGYLGWFKDQPSEPEASALLDAKFEVDKGETLAIEESITVEELAGVHSRHTT